MGNCGIFCGSVRSKPVPDFLKQEPLVVPVNPADERPQASLVEALNGGQKKDPFLNIRSQIEQLHDLGHAGARHPAETGQFRIIRNRFRQQQPLKADGERHEARDPGSGAAARFARGQRSIRCRGLVLPPSLSASAKIERVCDFLFAAHALTSPAAAAIAVGWNRIEICRAAPS